MGAFPGGKCTDYQAIIPQEIRYLLRGTSHHLFFLDVPSLVRQWRYDLIQLVCHLMFLFPDR